MHTFINSTAVNVTFFEGMLTMGESHSHRHWLCFFFVRLPGTTGEKRTCTKPGGPTGTYFSYKRLIKDGLGRGMLALKLEKKKRFSVYKGPKMQISGSECTTVMPS